jgi:protease-4
MAEKKWGQKEQGEGIGSLLGGRNIMFLGAGVIAFGIFTGILIMLLFGSVELPFQDCVAVVNVDGEISSSGSPATLFDEGSPSSSDIADTIKSLDDRNDVKAVVIRVNSPGGGVLASKEIYNAVNGLNKTKVAYLYEMAASGGYYVALGSDYIVAEPDTLTGSIGVITMTMDITGLMEKIGVNVSTIKSAQHKDFLEPMKEADPEEVAIMQEIINETYQDFVGVLKESRGSRISGSNITMLTDGRIFSGKQALKYGLVDQLGSKDDAIKKAADMAGMEYGKEPKVCNIKYTSGSSSGIFSEISKSVATIMSANQISQTGLYMK